MQIFASDDGHADGVIPTDAFLDELHRHKSLKLYRTWRGKLLKRNGQMATISTSGEPGTEFEETREKIRQSAEETERDGGFAKFVNGSVLMHEWAVPEGGDVEDIGLVKAANPFSGVTVEDLREKLNSPTMTMSHWRRFVCNLPTRSVSSAITEVEWEAARVSVGEWAPAGTPIFGAGLDVAWVKDTTALVPLWCPSRERRVLGPPVILDPNRDNTMIDPRDVQSALLELHKRNPLGVLVMDTSNAKDIAVWAQSELGITVVDRGQTNQFAVADYDQFMEALRQGWLKHLGDRVFSRHVLNAMAKLLPGGDTRFDRPTQSRGDTGQQAVRVIDGLTAAAMVHSLYAAELEAPVSVYETREVVSV